MEAQYYLFGIAMYALAIIILSFINIFIPFEMFRIINLFIFLYAISLLGICICLHMYQNE